MRAGLCIRDEQGRNPFGFYRNHIVLILQDAFDHKEAFGDEEDAIFLQQIWMHDGVGDARFILEAEEQEALGCARTLACDDASSDAQTLAGGNGFKLAGAADAELVHLRATVRHGVGADSEASAMEVSNQTLFVSHWPKWRRRVGLREFFKQRPRVADGPLDLPEGVAAMECQFRVSSFRFLFTTEARSHRGNFQFPIVSFRLRTFGVCLHWPLAMEN